MFLIRDISSGMVYNKVNNPAAVFDCEGGVLHKIGEREKMVKFYEDMKSRYKKFGFHDIADDIKFMDLPKDQGEIDKVFNICDYIKRLYLKKQLH
ncbi:MULTISPECIES: hypothetical protein [Bacillus amyloliquefaciens group]|uniref:hypothetical protein n=1 Tax=Bacillus amyloliquefaciens group TaxID=1938374 RepID=UPI00073CB266|nr:MULTISPECIES: hypothetical protein [Bacillus amyloliquefaciens group]KTF59841.1 hypothetical protein AR691_14005 [Bacillus amyloliquefaciens]